MKHFFAIIAISIMSSSFVTLSAQDSTKATAKVTTKMESTKNIKSKNAKFAKKKANFEKYSDKDIEKLYDTMKSNKEKIQELTTENKNLLIQAKEVRRAKAIKHKTDRINHRVDNSENFVKSDIGKMKSEIKDLKQEIKLLKEELKKK